MAGLESRKLGNTKAKTPQHQLAKRKAAFDKKQRAKRAAGKANPADELEEEEGAKKSAGPKKKAGVIKAAIATPAVPKMLTEGEKNYRTRQNAKIKADRITALQNKLRTEIHGEQERARAGRKANAIRKAENEKKSMVVQEIKNIKAVKKLTPKQRRRARICLRHEL